MLLYYFKKIALLIGIVSGILTIVNVFWRSPFYNEKRIKIEHYSELMYLLSDGIDSLQVNYKGNELPNIWKSHIKIENNGLQIIQGVGSNSDILNDTLVLNVNGPFEIINLTMVQNDLEATLEQSENMIFITFKKWVQFEKIRIELLLCSKEDNVIPFISGNERDILGAEIRYNNLDVENLDDSTNNLDWLIKIKSWLPHNLLKIGKYFTMFIIMMFVIFPFYLVFSCISDYFKYKKWKRKYWPLFLKQLETSNIPDSEKEKYKKAPYNIPEVYHKEFSYLPTIVLGFWPAVLLILYIFIFFEPLIVYVMFAWYNL